MGPRVHSRDAGRWPSLREMTRPVPARRALAVGPLLALLACGGSAEGPSSPATPSPPGRPDLDSLLQQMTLEEKIGQMTQAERGSLRSESDIRAYFLGSILSGGGSAPPDPTAPGWADMYDRFQSEALASRLRIPLLYGIDAVHGHNNVRGAVIFPHNIGLGCTRDPDLVERVARATAEEVEATGIDWTFAPCIAVPRDERWGRTYEGFGETPELVAEMAAAAVRGYQPTILACAKHYLADGGTAGGVDQGDARIDEATLRAIHLPGYRAAVAAGVGSVMASYSSWNGQKMHGNRYLLTDVLKGELGFEGFVVSDWAGIDQLPGDYASDVETAVNAGIDMVMVPDRYAEFTSTLRGLVEAGRVPVSRIDDAVRRILRAKAAQGLFEKPYADPSLLSRVGSEEHRQIAREAVQESLVLLKNAGGLLPLSKMTGRIHVAGKNADDLGNQCGGWTITWQGSSGRITTGTTILEGVRAAVLSGTAVTWSRDGSGAAGADVGVVVIGERPYAEGAGDRADLSLDAADVAAVRAVKGAGVPTVVVLVSGRPMVLGPALDEADALLAAWLPGTEGEGVADVLFGDVSPRGKLSHSWPRSTAQVPINVGDPDYDPLFPYGFGLTY
jgi:beta-glucosidase